MTETNSALASAPAADAVPENFPIAIAAGLGSAIVGAAIWAAVTVVTNMELGIIAVAIGYLVGHAIRAVGHGRSQKFGYLGAACGLLGCLLGNIMSDLAFYAQATHAPIMQVLTGVNFALLERLMTVFFSPMDLLFYAIAVYEGYKILVPQVKQRSDIFGSGLLVLFTAAKAGKILLTVGTMLLSIWAYSLLWGWRFALGFVVLIFIHEMGHYLAAQQKGLHVGLPTFIPFVGAWIALKETPMSVETESYVAFAGPLAGTVGALGCYFLARYYDSDLLLALSYAGFFLNLFNLIPLSPFDGGRITAILSPRIWLIGAPLLVALFFWRPSPLLIVMALLAAPQVMMAFRYDAKAPENAAYYATSLSTKIVYATFYLGLAGYLAVMSYDVHNMLGAG